MSDESFANSRQAESRCARALPTSAGMINAALTGGATCQDGQATALGLEMHRNKSPTVDLER